MAIKYHNPKSVSLSGKYSLGAEVEAGARYLFVSGQVGVDSRGKLQPTFEKQAVQVRFDGRDRPSDHDTRQPVVDQADPLNIRARQERSEGAAEHICGAESEHQVDARRAAGSADLRFLKGAVQPEPDRDVDAAHQRQQTPPPRYWI